jgi:hypothetical protein
VSAIGVAVLGLVGMACEPAPMELTLGVSRQGTFEFVPSEPGSADPGRAGVRLNGTIACTRPSQVTVAPTIDASSVLSGTRPLVLDAVAAPCDGPDGNRWTQLWTVDPASVWWGSPGPFIITVVAQSADDDPDTVSVTRLVTFTSV